MAIIPLSYNVRSMRARGTATAFTLLSIAATVAVLAGLLCLQQGFTSMFAERGRPDVAVFLRPGAGSEGESAFPRELADILIKDTPEVATDASGQPLGSAELYLAIRRPRIDGADINVPFRGVQPRTFDIHGDDIRIVAGRRFNPGADELIVARALTHRIRDCNIDDVLMVNTTPFRVVGTFESTGPYAAEIWGDADRLREALQRPVYSRVIAKLREGVDVAALSERLESDKRVPAKVLTERDYLESQTTALSGMFIAVGAFLAILMGIGAVFTGTNTMLSAVTARTREIGILLAIGFRPHALFVSFLLEAALLGVLGGLLGCLFVLPLNNVQTGTMNFQTFSEVTFAFRITPEVLGISIGFAVLLGVFGGAWPAWRAARMTPTHALRRG
jgi:putative ABC transport system permease protein